MTATDKFATAIRNKMRTKARISKIMFICESIDEANKIYSLALILSSKYVKGMTEYMTGKYHVRLVDKTSSGWESWYQGR